METTGKLIDVASDFKTLKRRLTFVVDNVSDEEVNRLYGLDTLDIKAVRHTVKRSLTANAYFHKLVSLIADAMTISKARAKNEMITRYGQRLFLENGEPATIKTNIEIDQAYEMEEPHLKYLKTDNGGNFYYVYRGSHTYNSKEMSVLIEGTVADAKELGIETLPNHAIKSMLDIWGQKNGSMESN